MFASVLKGRYKSHTFEVRLHILLEKTMKKSQGGYQNGISLSNKFVYRNIDKPRLSVQKKMGEFGGQNAHSTLNTDCESGV